MPSRRLGAATIAFVAVAVLSLVVLFAPSGAGQQRFPHDDKVVHLLLFASLAATTRWRFGSSTSVLLAVAAYAPVSELVQASLLPGRSGDARDVVADLVGVAFGWYRARRWQQRRADEPQVQQWAAQDRAADECSGL